MAADLAFVIAGHHAGLANGVDLEGRFRKALQPYAVWEQEAGALPPATTLRPTQNIAPSPCRGFGPAFLIRMLFSCLVDADWEAVARGALKDGRCSDPSDKLRRATENWAAPVVEAQMPIPT